jgi:peptidylprolyl isomerase
MTRVRVMTDLPQAERPKLEVMDTRSAAFRTIVDHARHREGADFSVCDVDVPVRKR